MAPVVGGLIIIISLITAFTKFIIIGFAAYYYSWRSLQAFLGAFGLLEFILMYLLFPETSQPGARGIDKLAGRKPARFVVINPLRPLALLRSPNLLLIVCGFCKSGRYVISLRYNAISQSYCRPPWYHIIVSLIFFFSFEDRLTVIFLVLMVPLAYTLVNILFICLSQSLTD